MSIFFAITDHVFFIFVKRPTKACLFSNSVSFKDTHREKKPPSNKTPALTESMNLDIWVVGTLNQLFIRDS